jgi:hypothetical protein
MGIRIYAQAQARFVAGTAEVLGGIAVTIATLAGAAHVGAEEIGSAGIVIRLANIPLIATAIGILAKPDNGVLPIYEVPGTIIPVITAHIRVWVTGGQTGAGLIGGRLVANLAARAITIVVAKVAGVLLRHAI